MRTPFLQPLICLAAGFLVLRGLVPGASAGAPPARKTASRRPGEIWKDPATGMEFVFVPGGCFQMGQGEAEAKSLLAAEGRTKYDFEHRGELPRHEVCLDAFWMGKYEVTNRQYRLYLSQHDSGKHRGLPLNGDSQPVANVNAFEAEAFAEWLGKKTGKAFRLPTEAEWEYAARGGGRGEMYAGTSKDEEIHLFANIGDRAFAVASGRKVTPGDKDDGYVVSSPVGSFRPNSLGLYDMTGNVEEWCSDWYDRDFYARSPRDNPQKPPPRKGADIEGVLRGGSWVLTQVNTRNAERIYRWADSGAPWSGFRLVLPAAD